MRTLRYDGTPDGFLCAAAEALGESPLPTITSMPRGQPTQGFLFQQETVHTDAQRTAGLIERVEAICGHKSVSATFCALLADHPQRDTWLLHTMATALGAACSFEDLAGDATVHSLLKLVQAVRREIHRFKGILRFSELRDGTYYAPVTPDHNIVVALAPYFTQRLGDRPWVIHDQRRDVAVHFDGSRVRPVDAANATSAGLEYAEKEAEYRACWRTYCREIAVQERINPRLQRQFLPMRYWQHLPEMHSDSPTLRKGLPRTTSQKKNADTSTAP